MVATKDVRNACRTSEKASAEKQYAENWRTAESPCMGDAKKSQFRQNSGQIQAGEQQTAMKNVNTAMSLMCNVESFVSCLATSDDEIKFTIIPEASTTSLFA